MKKYFLIPVAIIFCAINPTPGSTQQRNKDTNWNPLMVSSPFRYSTSPARMSGTTEKMYLNDININCLVNFKKKFSNVEDETWSKQANGEYVASFTADSISFMVRYDKKGRWQSTLKGYKENKMLFEIRDMVKRAYYDFAIDHIDEIETFNNNNVITYFVYMHFSNVTKIIRISEKEMDIWLEMKKE